MGRLGRGGVGVGRSACVSVFGESESSFLITYRSGLKMVEKLHFGPIRAFRPMGALAQLSI